MTRRTLTRTERKQIRNTFYTRVRIAADGTMTFRETYFYRHGRSEDKLAFTVRRGLEGLGFHPDAVKIVQTADHYNAWPKLSFFEVIAVIDDERQIAHANAENIAAAQDLAAAASNQKES